MTKWFKPWLLLMFAAVSLALGQSVQPVLQPHQFFVNGSGQPCAGCSLYTYAAGTTTPQPTYTDYTGSVQNTNPIITDISGSANIWGTPVLYKFILIDASGNTVWSVDHIPAGGLGSIIGGTTGAATVYTNSSSIGSEPTWLYEDQFSGANTAAKVSNAITSLPSTGGTNLGMIVIPSSEQAYNSTTNPMLTTGQQNANCWDFRQAVRAGWPTGGSFYSDCSDWAAQNWFFSPRWSNLWIGGQYNASLYTNNTIGMTGLSVREDFVGTPPSSAIQANDGAGIIGAIDPGYQSATTRTFTSGVEAQSNYVGAYSGTTPGAAVEVYDTRALTANWADQNPGTENGIIGNLVVLDAQGLGVTSLGALRMGGYRGIHAEIPAVPQSSICMQGTATITNGQVLLTYASGDHFNDRVQTQNRPIWIGTASGGTCAKPTGAVAYSIGSSPNPTTLSIQQAYAGSTGTVYWTMFGSEASIEADDSMIFDYTQKGTSPFYLDPWCNCGGGINLTVAGNLSEMTWFVNPTAADLQANGTYPAMGLGTDGTGHLAGFSQAGANIWNFSQQGDLTLARNIVAGAGTASSINNLTATASFTSSGSSVFSGTVALQNATTVPASATLTATGSGIIAATTMQLFGTSGSLGGSALAAGACSTIPVTIPGVTTTMVPTIAPAGGSNPGAGFWWDGYVSAANTVTVRVCASVAGTPSAITYNIRVIQ